MQWLPYDHYTLESAATPDELHQRGNELASRAAATRGEIVDFCGEVTPAGFRLRPTYLMLRPFVPLLWGRFEPSDEKTLIHVEAVLGTRWLLWLASPFILFNVLVFRTGQHVWFWSCGLLVTAWFFSMLPFWGDAGRARQKLTDFFR